jgi:hypothetical protein
MHSANRALVTLWMYSAAFVTVVLALAAVYRVSWQLGLLAVFMGVCFLPMRRFVRLLGQY